MVIPYMLHGDMIRPGSGLKQYGRAYIVEITTPITEQARASLIWGTREEDDRVSRTVGSMKDRRVLLTRFLARHNLSYLVRKDSERL